MSGHSGFALRNILRIFALFLSLLFIAVLGVTPSVSWALDPGEILVAANKNAFHSVSLARYYMKKRGIPEDHLIKLRVTDTERCSREDYEKNVAAPVRRYLEQEDPGRRIRCLVIMYGLPLKVAQPELTLEEETKLKRLQGRRDALRRRISGMEKDNIKINALKEEMGSLKKEILTLKKANQSSSLDSEVALALAENYPLSGWVSNPYFLGFKGKELSIRKEDVLMVSRLDGPSDKVVKRIIDDSIKAEKEGLKGTAYFDARWPEPGDKKVSGYAFYDASIHKAANLIKKTKLMPVVIDSKQELFQPGQCPEAALYCGWYKLSHYLDAFQWRPGSVGYHIASGECATLHRKDSHVWCKMMLEKGIAATLGPVDEPYVQAFPVPEIFFGFLADGYFSLAECYLVSIPYLSWKMVLIGDPLYRPFRNRVGQPHIHQTPHT